MAGRPARTPHAALLSFPKNNVVCAAGLAGEIGPITKYPTEGAIFGRAGLHPSRYRSDKVARCDGSLVLGRNRAQRKVLLVISDN
jgi:hypothetical protein